MPDAEAVAFMRRYCNNKFNHGSTELLNHEKRYNLFSVFPFFSAFVISILNDPGLETFGIKVKIDNLHSCFDKGFSDNMLFVDSTIK